MTGGADGQYHGGPLAGALQSARLGQRLHDRQPEGEQGPAAAAGGAFLVVPVLLRHQPRPCWLRGLLPGVRRAHLADSFTSVELRRRDLRAERPGLRQPGPCQHRHPQLPLADRPGLGQQQYEALERRLAEAPAIGVPTITLEGDANGAPHSDPASYAGRFTGWYAHRFIGGGVGHNLPQEAPRDFAQAVIDADAA